MKTKYSFNFQTGPISPIVISDSVSEISAYGAGAHAIFLGLVRQDCIDSKVVAEIDYSAYFELAENEMDKICLKTIGQFNDLQFMKIIHSTGTVKINEISLLVLVACGHRKESFRALEFVVEQIKYHLPVWKKEIFTDGSFVWGENKF
jgi:molybdopterin synthase catalytic subunit